MHAHKHGTRQPPHRHISANPGLICPTLPSSSLPPPAGRAAAAAGGADPAQRCAAGQGGAGSGGGHAAAAAHRERGALAHATLRRGRRGARGRGGGGDRRGHHQPAVRRLLLALAAHGARPSLRGRAAVARGHGAEFTPVGARHPLCLTPFHICALPISIFLGRVLLAIALLSAPLHARRCHSLAIPLWAPAA